MREMGMKYLCIFTFGMFWYISKCQRQKIFTFSQVIFKLLSKMHFISEIKVLKPKIRLPELNTLNHFVVAASSEQENDTGFILIIADCLTLTVKKKKYLNLPNYDVWEVTVVESM